jgi:murein DD-endopeptidase MepM/ murein hydrolase activator NlpD
MTTNNLRLTVQHFFRHLPRPHAYGLIALIAALSVISIYQIIASDDLPQEVALQSTTLTLAQTAQTTTAASSIEENTTAPLSPESAAIMADTISAPQNDMLAQMTAPLVPVKPAEPKFHKVREIVKPGDTLSSLFSRAGVSTGQMYQLLNSHNKAKTLERIYPGHALEFLLDKDNSIVALEHIQDALNKEVFTKQGDKYRYEIISKKPEVRLTRTQGTITHSLYMAGKKANLDDRLTMSLANIFAWDVDFALDIRKNDKFVVVYEERYLEGKRIGTGNIVAAEFINQGKSYKAVRYEDRQGRAQYYTPEGNTMRKAFLRSPIEFARISSHFNLNRKHPILNTIRAHKGTDYAASTGTPIQASGDGKVTFAGRKSGYGNVLIIQHNQTYQTLYAHLSKFGKQVKSGSYVKQGQIVAYVGMTGLATGPHLHYEFRVNGVVRNPVTVQLPNADPVAKADRERFFAQTRSLVAKLEGAKNEPTQIASKEPSTTQAPM